MLASLKHILDQEAFPWTSARPAMVLSWGSWGPCGNEAPAKPSTRDKRAVEVEGTRPCGPWTLSCPSSAWTPLPLQ